MRGVSAKAGLKRAANGPRSSGVHLTDGWRFISNGYRQRGFTSHESAYMKSTTLFSLYASVLVALLLGIGWVSLYSLDKSRWWDARIQLAQESYALHLRLEANVFRLLKQHGDALLIGDRDQGVGERDLGARIDRNLVDIRGTIAREIEMVGEEEIEELEVLRQMEAAIRQINAALVRLTASGEPIQTDIQIRNLADLLDRQVDIRLHDLIESALQEELEEVEETLAEAAAFRTWNEKLVYGLLATTLVLLVIGFVSFNYQIRVPLLRLKSAMSRLRQSQYAAPLNLGGSREFRDLSDILHDMTQSLAERESSREEQQKQLETTVARRTAELQRMIDRLEASEENRKRLMADISHELRTPLTIILGEAEVALRNAKGLSAEAADTLSCIRDSAKHTNQIVDDMLTVARQEAGQLRLDRRNVDLRTILRDAVDMFPQLINLDLPAGTAPLGVDAVRIRQSVLALFQNARRYGGPTIHARLVKGPTGFRITVEDDGPGLSTDEKRMAFDRFFRGSNVSGEGLEGTGLGLPVVRSIIEAHGGAVTLGDADLGGLAVHIDLPRAPAIHAVAVQPATKRA